MARTRNIETYSILYVDEGAGVHVENGLRAEEVKTKLAQFKEDPAGGQVFVFAGPEIKWGTEITLYADDAPTQQPVEKKRRGRKPKEAKPAEPPKVANGAGEKKEEVRS